MRRDSRGDAQYSLKNKTGHLPVIFVLLIASAPPVLAQTSTLSVGAMPYVHEVVADGAEWKSGAPR